MPSDASTLPAWTSLCLSSRPACCESVELEQEEGNTGDTETLVAVQSSTSQFDRRPRLCVPGWEQWHQTLSCDTVPDGCFYVSGWLQSDTLCSGCQWDCLKKIPNKREKRDMWQSGTNIYLRRCTRTQRICFSSLLPGLISLGCTASELAEWTLFTLHFVADSKFFIKIKKHTDIIIIIIIRSICQVIFSYNTCFTKSTWYAGTWLHLVCTIKELKVPGWQNERSVNAS